MKTYVYFCMYVEHILLKFVLQLKIFRTKVVEENEEYILRTLYVFLVRHTIRAITKQKWEKVLRLLRYAFIC
jgi:hypothetical protein